MKKEEKERLQNTILAFATAVLVTRHIPNKKALLDTYTRFYNHFMECCTDRTVRVAMKTCYELDMQERKVNSNAFDYQYYYRVIGQSLRIVNDVIAEA